MVKKYILVSDDYCNTQDTMLPDYFVGIVESKGDKQLLSWQSSFNYKSAMQFDTQQEAVEFAIKHHLTQYEALEYNPAWMIYYTDPNGRSRIKMISAMTLDDAFDTFTKSRIPGCDAIDYDQSALAVFSEVLHLPHTYVK